MIILSVFISILRNLLPRFKHNLSNLSLIRLICLSIVLSTSLISNIIGLGIKVLDFSKIITVDLLGNKSSTLQQINKVKILLLL